MKRIGYLYDELISVYNCKKAIINATKNRHNIWTKREMKYVRDVLIDIDNKSVDLSKSIQELNFLHPYKVTHIIDRCSSKLRELKMSKFYSDQCAFHAIKNIYEPIILKSSYYWSCANIKGRGIKRAYIGTYRCTKKYKYCLEMDIKGFYPNIDNEILKKLIKEKIKDKRFLEVLFYVIDQTPGQPIGNVLSPLNAELYLQELDLNLCNIKGIKHIRYADDFRIFSNSKRKLHKVARYVIKYLKEERNATIKPNWQVFKINSKSKTALKNNGRKVDFVGFCFSKDYVTIRKRRALKIIQQSNLINRLRIRGLDIYLKTARSHLSRTCAYLFSNSFNMQQKYKRHIKHLKDVVRSATCGLNKKVTLDLIQLN